MKKILALILARISKRIISKYDPKIVGITGSFGKSSVKEAVFAALSVGEKKVRRSRGNFNNELGFPLAIIGDFHRTGGAFFWMGVVIKGLGMIFRKVDYPEILVLEYGADKPGDIDYLTDIAQPDIAIITGISDIPVHVEFYADAEAVAAEKSKLVRSLPGDGVAILNADDPLVAKMAEKTETGTVFYGFADEADFRVSQFSNTSSAGAPTGITFKLNTIGKSAPVTISDTVGKAQAYAAASAAACGSLFGVNLMDSTLALSEYESLPGRARIIEGINGSWIIDDTYNASPKAVMEVLAALRELSGKRKIAVLGGMMELGKYSDDAHIAVSKEAARSADIVIGVGAKGELLASAAKESGKETKIFSSAEEAAEEVRSMIEEGDMVLVKGSQSVRMERVVKAIMKHPEQAKELLVRQHDKWIKFDKK